MKKLVYIIICILFSIPILAQEEGGLEPFIESMLVVDTTSVDANALSNVVTDTSAVKSRKQKRKEGGFFHKNYPDPKKAMIMSFVVPGSGQLYNKKYWKAPIAIGGTVAMAFLVSNNTRNYKILRDEYKARVDDDIMTVPNPAWELWEDEDIRKERDKWNKWKEMSYIGIVLVQALGGVDAFVDAHFHGLKINEDLSFKIKPSFQSTSMNGVALGFGVKFQLNAPPLPQPTNFYFSGK